MILNFIHTTFFFHVPLHRGLLVTEKNICYRLGLRVPKLEDCRVLIITTRIPEMRVLKYPGTRLATI